MAERNFSNHEEKEEKNYHDQIKSNMSPRKGRINPDLARRFELLEQRFHSPSKIVSSNNQRSIVDGKMVNEKAVDAAASMLSSHSGTRSNSQMSRHSQSHSIGFVTSGSNPNNNRHSRTNEESASGAAGSSSSIISGSNAATRLISNALTTSTNNSEKGLQGTAETALSDQSQNSLSNKVGTSNVNMYSKSFREVNNAAEMHLQNCVVSKAAVRDKHRQALISSHLDKGQKRAVSPLRCKSPSLNLEKKESSRKKQKPVKKVETKYGNKTSSLSRRKARPSNAQSMVDPSNLFVGENSSNHATYAVSQPIQNYSKASIENSVSRDKSFSNQATIPPITRNTIQKKSGLKQKSIDAFIKSFRKSKSLNNGTTSIRDDYQSGSEPLSLTLHLGKSPSNIPQVPNSHVINNLELDISEVDLLKKKCLDLQRLCDDKEERLRAVSDNQTILHSSLKSALQQKEKEICFLHKSFEKKSASFMKTVERLVFADAAREAKGLRQKLASDGARLGRFVHSRAGLHTIESWEDGFAISSLKTRRAALLNKKADLLKKRQIDELKWTKQNQSRAHDTLSVVSQNSQSKNGMKDIDEIAANTSLQMHLCNIKKEEQKMALEEEALEKEKIRHIRQLRRVSNEDSSRFKLHPKLHDRYILYHLLGKGGFSEVWKAYDIVELREVAVKIHQLDPRWSETKKDNYTKHVSREYEIHRNVRHPRIVSLYDVFEIDSNSFATVLECCAGTDLDTTLKDEHHIPEKHARAILLQILSGMRYLTSSSDDGRRQGIIHFDLKPGNILFDEFGDAKITDFGLSKIVNAESPEDSMELTSQGAGTYWYLPPECFITNESVRISNKVDVWSIGVIYYQMLFGRRPFGHGESQDRVLRNQTMLNAREVEFPTKPLVTEEGKQFIKLCLTYDQAIRPSISELCENSYLIKENISY